jgi:hypothetical protein
MKIKEWPLTVYGILALFWPWISVKPFVKDDYEAELRTNKQLAARPKETREQFLRDYEPEVEKRLRIFRWGLWGSFLCLATAVMTAVVLVKFGWSVSAQQRMWLGGTSMFCFAWATLARLGRSAEALKTLQGFGGFLRETFGTVPQDVVGLLGGDWLKDRRAENLARTASLSRAIGRPACSGTQ